MERRTVDEVISLLRRSPVLAACRDEARSRRDLTDLTDFSRTTVYRSTVALTKRGLLEKTPAGYQTTPLGVALLAAGDSFASGVDALDRLEPLFERVSHPDLLEHAHLLTDARVVVADASNPYRVVERAMERFEATTRSRGTLASTTAAEAMDRAVPSMDDKESFERISLPAPSRPTRPSAAMPSTPSQRVTPSRCSSRTTTPFRSRSPSTTTASPSSVTTPRRDSRPSTSSRTGRRRERGSTACTRSVVRPRTRFETPVVDVVHIWGGSERGAFGH